MVDLLLHSSQTLVFHTGFLLSVIGFQYKLLGNHRISIVCRQTTCAYNLDSTVVHAPSTIAVDFYKRLIMLAQDLLRSLLEIAP